MTPLVINQRGSNSDEAIWREQVLWCINRFLLRAVPESVRPAELTELISLSTDWLGHTPALVRSVWLKGLLRHQANGIPWHFVMAQWQWSLFREADYAPELVNTTRLAPLAERVAMAVCRDLLQQIPVASVSIQAVLTQLEDLASRCPEQTFLPYFQARLWLKLDEKEKAMQVFMPFARQKQREFWVWSMLADLIDGSADDVIACLVQGVSLGTREPFLVKIRQKLADRLLTQGRWAEAKGEIELLVATRKQAGWKVPEIVANWMNDSQYTSTTGSIQTWYVPYCQLAQTWLWMDMPEVVGLVTAIDDTTRRVEIQVDSKTVGRFPADRFDLSPAVGDRLALRYTNETKEGTRLFRVLTVRPTMEPLTHLDAKITEGVLRINDKGFGFVGSVFVPQNLLADHPSWADQLVRVEAVPTWNSSKNNVGQKAFRISRI